MANRRVIVTDFHGETTTSQYDTLGRVVTTTFPDGSSQSYTYTSSGKIAAVTDSHGTTQYQYDSDERLTSVTDANGATISYSYDEFGRTQTVATPSGTTGYGLDTYGRLTSVTAPDGAETRYTYDEHGNKASMIYPNGTITEYGYDTLNRLISVETRTMTNDLLAAYSYTLNAKGQRTHVEEQPIGRTIEYDYDAADRLSEERISDPVLGNRTISYTYNPVGNRLRKDDNGVITEYSYDDNDRLLTETGSAYTYDKNGNLLTKTGNGETWHLTYNALNQVTQANITTPQGASVMEYAYDYDGIRIGKTINDTEVVQYVVDKNRPYAQVLEEEHTRGGLSATTSYVYGDALISAATEGSTHYYHTDGLGSMRHLSDASGALTDSYTYDAYGLLTTSRGATVNPYLYRGEQDDADLDAYYLRARYYQPGIGRFLTTDPEEGFTSSPISLHRYVYGNASPVNYNDPSGETSLMDLTVTQVVLGNLAAIGVGMSLEPYFGVYSTLGKSVFPDAYIAGISGAFSLRLLKDIPLFENTPLSIPSMHHTTDIMFSGGFELLLNISSGQIALYSVLPFFNGNPLLPIPGFGAGGIPFSPDNNKKTGFSCAVYQGYVWNLWNADDYTEHFINFGVASANAFFDPTRVFAGPWGISRTLFNKSWPKNSTSHKVSYLRSSTFSYYQIIGSPRY
jgi:RHS repeat-associated protein